MSTIDLAIAAIPESQRGEVDRNGPPFVRCREILILK